jgi:hypothetical protein
LPTVSTYKAYRLVSCHAHAIWSTSDDAIDAPAGLQYNLLDIRFMLLLLLLTLLMLMLPPSTAVLSEAVTVTHRHD